RGHQVLRVDVAVEEVLFVDRGEGARGVGGPACQLGLVRTRFALATADLFEGLAIDPLQDDEGLFRRPALEVLDEPLLPGELLSQRGLPGSKPGLLAVTEDADDVRMIEPGQQGRFLPEPGPVLLAQTVPQYLDGHAADGR